MFCLTYLGNQVPRYVGTLLVFAVLLTGFLLSGIWREPQASARGKKVSSIERASRRSNAVETLATVATSKTDTPEMPRSLGVSWGDENVEYFGHSTTFS